MAKIAGIFPGQGSQSVGMGQALYEAYPFVKDIFAKANDIMAKDMAELCFQGPEEELKKTVNTQPALFLANHVYYEVLRKTGRSFDIVAGHSLGEYNALVAAEVLDFESALDIVRHRAEYMYEAGTARPGTMAAVMKLEENDVREICEAAGEKGVCNIANINSPGQIVISGEVDAVKAACDLAKEKKGRAIPLKVSGAFHSSLIAEAGDKLRPVIESKEWKSPKIAVVQNVNAGIEDDPKKIAENMISQIASPVLWAPSVRRITLEGADLFIETGPGKVLTGLVKKISPDSEVLTATEAPLADELLAAGQ
jgi:[acyl-carrier-protein] S-malonyltransferase